MCVYIPLFFACYQSFNLLTVADIPDRARWCLISYLLIEIELNIITFHKHYGSWVLCGPFCDILLHRHKIIFYQLCSPSSFLFLWQEMITLLNMTGILSWRWSMYEIATLKQMTPLSWWTLLWLLCGNIFSQHHMGCALHIRQQWLAWLERWHNCGDKE